jgi:hypothetical protein
MKLEVLRKEEQVDGQFNGGAILEKRPIVYQDEKTFPYSNIFYWAHAWSEKGSTIGLHPHQGFEILTFILKGSIEHYDSKNQKWIPLNEGSVQIIRSGSGISHAEKVNPDSSIFQIWFDPDLNRTLRTPASYNDFSSDSFKAETKNGISTRTFKGDGSPIKMMTEGIQIKELRLKKGNHQIQISDDKIISAFLISGSIKIDKEQLMAEDFFKIQDTSSTNIEAMEESWLFIIESPVTPSYRTYASMNLG